MTWTVVSSILFVVATVLAIFSSVSANKAQLELATQQQKYDKVLADTDLSGDLVTGLQAVQAANPTKYTGKLLNVALQQRDELARRLAGGNADDALNKADATLAKVKADKALKLGGDNLNAVATGLYGAVQGRDQQIRQLTGAQKDLTAKLAAVQQTFATQMAAMKGDLDKANEATQTAVATVETNRTKNDAAVADIQKTSNENYTVAQDTVNQVSAQLQEANGKVKKLEDQNKALQGKLRDIRQPVDQITRQADAHIMRLGGDGIVYIDLGTGDQISAGMTFEVYDRTQGIPKNGDPQNDDNLPKGKASIEVIKASPGSSECRIVRQTPGETVVEGDLVVNLVYDKNVKYNVMVYGNFDLDRNGQATPQDADVIRRLVTRWGGKVVSKLTADTDFLVIGKAPEVPNPSQEDLDKPEVQFEVDRKKKELAEYDDLLAQAGALNVPVLNQNRFLYFTGYYEQSAR